MIKHANDRLLGEQEIGLGEAPHWTAHFFRAFPAFAHANYRLFFSGQFISLIGTWIQLVALGWLVLELTNSAFWVSLIYALDTLPIVLSSLPAGILADRFEKRKIIIITHIFSVIFAFLFAFFIHIQWVNLALIILFTFLLGAAHAVEMPTRQAFVFDVVGKRDIASAIAMNVGMFNSARVIGPAVAGIVISLFNTQVAFLLNRLSFLAVIFVLLRMRVRKIAPSAEHAHPWTQLKEGIQFAFKNPVIQTLLFVVAFTSTIPWAYNSIMPVVAKEIFHKGASGFGILLSAAGVGALISAVFVSSMSEKLNVAKTIAMASTTICFILFTFSFVQNFALALLMLLVTGFCLVAIISLANASIQRASPDNMRGRVLSVYSLMFLGTMPVGSILMGILANNIGVQMALRLFGIITLLGAAIYIFLLKKRLEGLSKKFLI